MIPGVTLTNGATTITVAPMNLRIQFGDDTKDAADIVLDGRNDDPKAYQKAAVDIILACARRNHPELSRETLYEVLDYADIRPTLLSVLSKSGFKPRPLAESPTPASASPAPTSLGNSSTEQAGPSTTSSTA